MRNYTDTELIREFNNMFQKVPENNSPFGGYIQGLMSSSKFNYPPLIDGIEGKSHFSELIRDESQKYVSNRLALIGNCAHNTQYFGLFGENVGFNDAAILANVLIRAMKEG